MYGDPWGIETEDISFVDAIRVEKEYLSLCEHSL